MKEGLEINYSLKRSDKSLERDQRWRYLTDRYIFANYASCNNFFAAGNVVLKTVDYFETKIKNAKQGKSKNMMKLWNDKLNTFLSIPFHDHFNAVSVTKFRCYEYPSTTAGQVASLCLNCTSSECPGCFLAKLPPPKPAPQPRRPSQSAPSPSRGAAATAAAIPQMPQPTKITPELKIKMQSGTKQQLYFYKGTKIWLSVSKLKAEYARVGKALGHKRLATSKEAVHYKLQEMANQRRRAKEAMARLAQANAAGGRRPVGRPPTKNPGGRPPPSGRGPGRPPTRKPGRPSALAIKQQKPRRRPNEQQQVYYDTFGIWKSLDQLRNEYIRVGKRLGYKRPASLTEVIKYIQDEEGGGGASVKEPGERVRRKPAEQQQLYYDTFNVWKTTEELREEYAKVGEYLGYKRPASLTETIKYIQEHGAISTNNHEHHTTAVEVIPMEIHSTTSFAHYCANCSSTFERVDDLSVHQMTCGGSSSTYQEVETISADHQPTTSEEALLGTVESEEFAATPVVGDPVGSEEAMVTGDDDTIVVSGQIPVTNDTQAQEDDDSSSAAAAEQSSGVTAAAGGGEGGSPAVMPWMLPAEDDEEAGNADENSAILPD